MSDKNLSFLVAVVIMLAGMMILFVLAGGLEILDEFIEK